MSGAQFSDLRVRVSSAIVLVAIGAVAIWLGGLAFAALGIVVAGLIGWELYRMMMPDAPQGRAEAHGLASAALVGVFAFNLGGWFSVIGLAVGALLLALRMPRDKAIFGGYLFLGLLGTMGLLQLRLQPELPFWLVPWLILVVIASDVAGYFAGRLLGGPKFWPRVSPKKTWSGTIAGWIGAGLVGWVWVVWQNAGWETIGISIALAMMAQMGDIAESAVKRKASVKDSSNLLPGHGGLFDRFDAMLGAALMLLVIESLMEFPPVPGV